MELEKAGVVRTVTTNQDRVRLVFDGWKPKKPAKRPKPAPAPESPEA